MRDIAIIGAGQSGLQLAFGLLAKGYTVSVYSDRTPEEIENGFIMSSQCMFNTPLDYERELDLNFWDESCPNIDGIALSLMAPGTTDKVISWSARLDNPAQSLDQRVKMPRWIREFEKRGGKMIYESADIDTLEKLAKTNDLVVIASGKGEIGKLFKRDAERSQFDKPMRALGLVYVHGMTPRKDYSAVDFNIAPGVGEFFVFPAQTLTGDCHILVFEGIPGGPMDGWPSMHDSKACFDYGMQLLKTHFPDQALLCKNAKLTDDKGVLAGRFPPTIKNPVGELPSGAIVYGIADCVCLNDPITGQGSNNASRAAKFNLDAILKHGGNDFSRDWMRATFEGNLAEVKTCVDWTNSMLLPPPEFRLNLLGAAGEIPELASRIANNFNTPSDFAPWWFEEDEANKLLASYTP
ncbi:MAG: alanine-phosphoribitol ligase [Robiginitomaculum sp.]|nr:MAG: alanine-phosphoribitol ligase [Robiginitomaculum sp.]